MNGQAAIASAGIIADIRILGNPLFDLPHVSYFSRVFRVFMMAGTS